MSHVGQQHYPSDNWSFVGNAYAETRDGVTHRLIYRTDAVQHSVPRTPVLGMQYPSHRDLLAAVSEVGRPDAEVYRALSAAENDDFIFALRVRTHRMKARHLEAERPTAILTRLLEMGTLSWRKPNRMADPHMRNFAYSAALANELLLRLEEEEKRVRAPSFPLN